MKFDKFVAKLRGTKDKFGLEPVELIILDEIVRKGEVTIMAFSDPSYSTSNHPVLGTPPSLTTTLPHTTGTWGASSITHAQALSLNEREKQQLCEALEDYNDKINLKEHEKLHKAFGLAVKAEVVKADRKKAVK
jgi:hypothetical protein